MTSSIDDFLPPTVRPLLAWVDDLPQPYEGRTLRKEQVSYLYLAAGSLPYRGEWDNESQQYVNEDSRLIGLTQIEALVIKQFDGALKSDSKACSDIFDRILGKPKQAVESMNMTMGYTEYLEYRAAQERDRQETQEYDLNGI